MNKTCCASKLTRLVRGSAAIYGLRNKENISIFILHPKGRVSPIQEAQMTTVTDANVHNVAVKGTFDDCQVKSNYLSFCGIVLRILWETKGYRQIPLWGSGFQRTAPPWGRKFHKLGSHPCSNGLLFLVIFPFCLTTPVGFVSRGH